MTTSSKVCLALAAAGAAFCSVKLIGFIRTIQQNRLEWEGTAQFTREHYIAVGRAYNQGFVVGFFLCFSLVLIAIIVGTWYEKARDERRRLRAEPARRQSQANEAEHQGDKALQSV